MKFSVQLIELFLKRKNLDLITIQSIKLPLKRQNLDLTTGPNLNGWMACKQVTPLLVEVKKKQKRKKCKGHFSPAAIIESTQERTTSFRGTHHCQISSSTQKKKE
jgi:hypothetical protein